MLAEYYDIKSIKGSPRPEQKIVVTVPGSKSITNRALLIAAMAEGRSLVRGCMASEDARHFLECLKALGFIVEERESAEASARKNRHTGQQEEIKIRDGGTDAIVRNHDVTITGCGGKIPAKEAEIYVGSAGTAARFLVAMLAFADGVYVVKSSQQMQRRPMQPLIDALRCAGAGVECLEEEGHFPLRIRGLVSDAPTSYQVNIDQSSQFLSALMIAAGTFHKEIHLQALGSHGLAYTDLTAAMMRQFGVGIRRYEIAGKELGYRLDGEGAYRAMTYDVEPDMSAAAYFYAMAAVLGCSVRVDGVREGMLQGDAAFLKVLGQMGCQIRQSDEGGIVVTGPAGGQLRGGFTIDMSAFSDQALTLSAIAPYADAPITITGIGHIRLQECDRMRAITENLGRLGIRAEATEDSVTIYPGMPQGAEVESYDDHRVAMSFALTGLRTEGVRICNPQCCRKTFAEYFDVLEDALRRVAAGA